MHRSVIGILLYSYIPTILRCSPHWPRSSRTWIVPPSPPCPFWFATLPTAPTEWAAYAAGRNCIVRRPGTRPSSVPALPRPASGHASTTWTRPPASPGTSPRGMRLRHKGSVGHYGVGRPHGFSPVPPAIDPAHIGRHRAARSGAALNHPGLVPSPRPVYSRPSRLLPNKSQAGAKK